MLHRSVCPKPTKTAIETSNLKSYTIQSYHENCIFENCTQLKNVFTLPNINSLYVFLYYMCSELRTDLFKTTIVLNLLSFFIKFQKDFLPFCQSPVGVQSSLLHSFGKEAIFIILCLPSSFTELRPSASPQSAASYLRQVSLVIRMVGYHQVSRRDVGFCRELCIIVNLMSPHRPVKVQFFQSHGQALGSPWVQLFMGSIA